MSMKADIKRWMSVAQNYGAVFENIDFELTEDGVRAVCIDKEKEFTIKVPTPWLIPREAIEIDEDEHYVLESFVREDEVRGVLNEYLDFVLSKERVAEQKRLISEFSALPASLKQKIASFGVVKLTKEMNDIEVKESLINVRTIYKDSKEILIPFIDFLNHNVREGISYSIFKDSVVVKGKPSDSGEIFTIYNNNADAFGFLNNYYFIDKSLFAYSMVIAVRLYDGTAFQIGRNITKFKMKCNGLRVPEKVEEDGKIVLPFVWLGSVNTPRKPFWSFKKVWEDELGRNDTVRVFSTIKGFNIKRLVEILEEADSLPKTKAVEMIKDAARWQLKVIGESFEDLNEMPC